jgi:hypothetical protein
MFSIDVGRDSARPLRLRHDVQRQSRLARAFRPINLDNAAAGNTADSDGCIQRQRRRGNRRHVGNITLAQAHYRALAESLFNVEQRGFDGATAFCKAVFRHNRHPFLLLLFDSSCDFPVATIHPVAQAPGFDMDRG